MRAPARARRLLREATAAVIVLGAMCAAGPARGQPAIAIELAAEGRRLMEQGKWEEARRSFEEVVRIEPTGVAAMAQLAYCHKQLDRLADAWALYRRAEVTARGQPGQEERARSYQEQAETLEPQVPRLTVHIDASLRAMEGIEVKRDEEVIPPAQWDIPLPVNPGRHSVAVTAWKKRWWTWNLDIKRASAETVNISLHEIGSPPARAPETPPAPLPAPSISDPAYLGTTQRFTGIVTGALGIAGLGVAGVFAIETVTKVNSSSRYCTPDDACKPEGARLREDAGTAQTTALVFVGVGAATLAGGIVVYATAPRAPKPHAPRIALAVAPGSLSLRGWW